MVSGEMSLRKARVLQSLNVPLAVIAASITYQAFKNGNVGLGVVAGVLVTFGVVAGALGQIRINKELKKVNPQ